MIIILLPYYMAKYYILGYIVYNKRLNTKNDWKSGEILKFETFVSLYKDRATIKIHLYKFRIVIDYIKNKKNEKH